MGKKTKSQGKGNVLVVEGDAGLRASVSRALTLAGYVAFEAEDGHQAFFLSETLDHPLHLMVTDTLLAGALSGVDIARHLKVLRPGLQVLYLSDVPADLALRRELELRLESYLSKPFAEETLLSKVAALMRRIRSGGSSGKGLRADWRPVEERAG